MPIFPFGREKRQESERVEQLRDSLKRVEQDEFLNGAAPAARGLAQEPDSLQTALARRAAEHGVSPEQLLRSYIDRLQNSTYPTPECLEPETVQSIVASGVTTDQQARHVQACETCRQLIEAAHPSAADMDRLMAVVHDGAARAQAPSDLILLIEGDTRSPLRDVLTRKGYNVVVASTGEEGVCLAEERRPRLVVVDTRLKGMDAFEALRQLRARPKTRSIPVMAMTLNITGSPKHIADAGFDAWQSEPIEPNEFLGDVARLLERG